MAGAGNSNMNSTSYSAGTVAEQLLRIYGELQPLSAKTGGGVKLQNAITKNSAKVQCLRLTSNNLEWRKALLH